MIRHCDEVRIESWAISNKGEYKREGTAGSKRGRKSYGTRIDVKIRAGIEFQIVDCYACSEIVLEPNVKGLAGSITLECYDVAGSVVKRHNGIIGIRTNGMGIDFEGCYAGSGVGCRFEDHCRGIGYTDRGIRKHDGRDIV